MIAPTASTLEGRGTGFQQLPLPLRDLHRMHPELGGQLIERLLPFDRLQRHARLEFAAMPASNCSHTSLPSSDPYLLSASLTYGPVQFSGDTTYCIIADGSEESSVTSLHIPAMTGTRE